MSEVAARIAAVRRPAPKPASVAAVGLMVILLMLGIVSFAGLGFTWEAMVESLAKVGPFMQRATPFVWPGFAFDPATRTVVFDSWSGIWEFLGSTVMTLGIVICGTYLSAVISIPVAYWGARNTTPHPALLAVARFIGVLARAIPAVAFASIFVFVFALGPLPGVLAFMFHSVGMISKMYSDAIEQIDEGPRLALRSTGATKAQEFWGGVVPQALPAWIAVGLHRADINLRETVILGYVGVAGLGYDLSNAIHALNYRRAIPLALAIVVLCILFEIVSSVIRARLLGVRPAGKGIGDTLVRTATSRSSTLARAIERPSGMDDSTSRVLAAMRQPWTRERITSTISVTLAILVIAGSFVASQANWANLITFWGNLPTLLAKDNLWPPTLGIYTAQEIGESILVTFQVAFAATLISAVISVLVGIPAARNVAPGPIVRNTFRGILLIIRGMPELILAILFVIISGLGAQAGTLALGIGGVGLLGKLIADSLEEVPGGPERAISAVGGTRPQVFFSSTLPMSIPAFAAHLLYLLEQNVRAATVLGIVGGGGIGYYLYDSLRVSKYDQVAAFLGLIILLVLLIEFAAILLRRALK